MLIMLRGNSVCCCGKSQRSTCNAHYVQESQASVNRDLMHLSIAISGLYQQRSDKPLSIKVSSICQQRYQASINRDIKDFKPQSIEISSLYGLKSQNPIIREASINRDPKLPSNISSSICQLITQASINRECWSLHKYGIDHMPL